MHKPTMLLFSGFFLFNTVATTTMHADESGYSASPQAEMDAPSFQQQPETPFTPFTGKITKNKVRLRLQPNLDSPIIKELAQGDMVIAVGETDDFYAVEPSQGQKGYVFRTYILDNVVEASKVNVRLEPDLDAPVLAQLRQGDRIEGTVSPQNNKWLEIAAPSSARFYVAREYVEKLGDASVMGTLSRRRDEVNMLLSTTFNASQNEFQKPFPEINLDGVYANLNKIIQDYSTFPEQVSRARELITSIQDSYIQKKISYLEAKSKIVQDDWQEKNSQLSEQMKSQQQKLAQLEQQLRRSRNGSAAPQASQNGMNNKMSAWMPVEENLYVAWSKENNNRSQDDFYVDQSKNTVELHGIIEPYNRVIKNKPGDYILVNQANHLPIAYLYSTKINLQDRVGQELTIHGAPRNNHNFAFPAYFVLDIE